MILPMSPVLTEFATAVIYTRKVFKRLAKASSNHMTLNVLDCVLNLHFKLLWIVGGRPHTLPCLHSVSVYLSVWQSACLSVSLLSLSKNVYNQTHTSSFYLSLSFSLCFCIDYFVTRHKHRHVCPSFSLPFSLSFLFTLPFCLSIWQSLCFSLSDFLFLNLPSYLSFSFSKSLSVFLLLSPSPSLSFSVSLSLSPQIFLNPFSLSLNMFSSYSL